MKIEDLEDEVSHLRLKAISPLFVSDDWDVVVSLPHPQMLRIKVNRMVEIVLVII